MKNSDVGIIKRDLEAVINQTILAALFYCSPTESGQNFLGFIVNYMLNFEMDKNIHWYVDQMAIFSAVIFLKKITSD